MTRSMREERHAQAEVLGLVLVIVIGMILLGHGSFVSPELILNVMR